MLLFVLVRQAVQPKEILPDLKSPIKMDNIIEILNAGFPKINWLELLNFFPNQKKCSAKPLVINPSCKSASIALYDRNRASP